MPDGWSDLLRGVDGADPPLDLRERIQRRRSADRGIAAEALGARTQRHGNRDGWTASWFHSRLVVWSCAIVGCLLVVGALAFAAHSRSDRPAPVSATARAALKTASGVEVRYPASWHARLQR